MVFDVKSTIAYASQGTTLKAGSIIMMGTPSGVVWARIPKRIVQHDDKVEIYHDGGIGTLVNVFKYE
jgi:2-keto-4-pentenoate hydratase/2-oxohepta-3-ene-1,7-dioic acid hydratase in catechol pathway